MEKRGLEQQELLEPREPRAARAARAAAEQVVLLVHLELLVHLAAAELLVLPVQAELLEQQALLVQVELLVLLAQAELPAVAERLVLLSLDLPDQLVEAEEDLLQLD